MQLSIDVRSLPEPKAEVGPAFVLTQGLIIKAAACLGMMCMGIYYVLVGKRDQRVGKMILGAALIMGSFLLFL